MNYLFVMAGAFLGATARYGTTLWFGEQDFPMATVTVNIIGCFLLSALLTLVSLSDRDRQIWALTFGTGFLGAFTTFSSFAVDALLLNLPATLLYIGLSLVLGIAFSGLGVWTARYSYLKLKNQRGV